MPPLAPYKLLSSKSVKKFVFSVNILKRKVPRVFCFAKFIRLNNMSTMILRHLLLIIDILYRYHFCAYESNA